MVPTSSEMIYGGQKSLSVVRDAIVTPTTVDKKRRTFTGCVYDSAGGSRSQLSANGRERLVAARGQRTHRSGLGPRGD